MSRLEERALAALLEDVAAETVFPPVPPLAEDVRRRIERGPRPVGQVHLPRTRPPVLRPVLAGLVVVALALGITLSLSATARRAVADLLGVAGIHITFGDDAGVAPRPQGPPDLGRRIDLSEASELAGFDVAVPHTPELSETPATYYAPDIGPTGMVSLVYPEDATRLRDIDVLITQFESPVDVIFVKKVADAGGRVDYVRVGDSDAYWIAGRRHLVYFVEDPGVDQSVRFARNVLLWEDDGVTYRVEGAGSRAMALRIARSLRP